MPGPGPLDQMAPDSSARWLTCRLTPISQIRSTHANPAHTGTQGHACRGNVSFVIGGWWMACIKDIDKKARTLLTGRTGSGRGSGTGGDSHARPLPGDSTWSQMIRAEGDLGSSDLKLCPLVTPPPLEALLAKGQDHRAHCQSGLPGWLGSLWHLGSIW